MESPFANQFIHPGMPDRGPVVSFARIDDRIPVDQLQAELAMLLGHDWLDHVNRRDYSGGWDVLPLRCQREHLQAHPILQGFAISHGNDWADLPVLDDCPAMRAVLAWLQCPLKSARLMRLKAGAQIKPHSDPDLSLESGQARLHLPIQTSDRIEFKVDRQVVPMRAGELWYFNAELEHEVHNLGSEDRINLVVDCVANDWLRERIEASDALCWSGGADRR
jgi:hypothetical protein